MAKITKIKAQKNRERVNIYLDGRFAFPLDLDNFLKAGLKVGQELSEEEIETLVFKNESQKLLNKAGRLLSFRPRSEKEMRDYLKKKKVRPKLAAWIISKLKKQGYLNDEEFARWWLEQRSTFRPRGKIGLKTELRQKGVSREIIERVVDQTVNELVLARQVIRQKIKSLKKLSRPERQQKITGFLSRRGFGWETIKQILEEMKLS